MYGRLGACGAMVPAAPMDTSTADGPLGRHSASWFREMVLQVVLLGIFNGQGLAECRALVRVNPGQEYIKLLLHDGRLKGAVLIGDTDLEETCENLLLDQLDLGPLADHLLDPEVDIEDFFD